MQVFVLHVPRERLEAAFVLSHRLFKDASHFLMQRRVSF